MADHNGKTGPTTSQRRLWGRRGALLLHGSGRTYVGPAHEALRRKFEALADPDGTLAPEVRERRAKQLRTAEMIRLSLAAVDARRKKRGPAHAA
jgi:hypothetical protein